MPCFNSIGNRIYKETRYRIYLQVSSKAARKQAFSAVEKGGFVFHDLRRTAKTLARNAGVDKNIRMVMFGNSASNDMDLR